MVTRVDSLLNSEQVSQDFGAWLARQDFAHVEERKMLQRCYDYLALHDASMSGGSGLSLLQFGLSMVDLLFALHMDSRAMVVGLLYQFVRERRIALDDDVESLAGEQSVELITRIERMDIIGELFERGHARGDGEKVHSAHLRKMLLGMVSDVRVVVIKLVERLCMLRAVKLGSRDEQRALAQIVLDVYAPLANRLGIGQLKWELEDLAYRYLEPESYKNIAGLLDERRVDREEYIARVIELIELELEKHAIFAEVRGRAKHIYSIVLKMRRKHVGFDEIYDIRAVRILVDTVPQCYAVLGVIHSLWRHVPSEFDDYIANPKENGYRSIHTAVVGPDGKYLEIQIRTRQMHKESELGIAAHWQYKEGGVADSADAEKKVTWLRKVLEWHEELADSDTFLKELQMEVSDERVYVFTPLGDIVDLVKGATPVDFAYVIHTEVGHRCRGAKIHGRIVPLTYELENGDRVEILTGKEARPSRDWLHPHLGYIKTPRARAKVHHWFKLQDEERNLEAGRKLWQRESQKLGLGAVDLDVLAKRLNFPSADILMIAIGSGAIRLSRVTTMAYKLTDQPMVPVDKSQYIVRQPIPADVVVAGMGQVATHLAKCCKPVPGDSIVGYVTRGRGVTVHRVDCGTLVRMESQEHERLIEVGWGQHVGQSYSVQVIIEAYDRQTLLLDISRVFATYHVNLLKIDMRHIKGDEMVVMFNLMLALDHIDTLQTVLNKLNQLPNVLRVERVV